MRQELGDSVQVRRRGVRGEGEVVLVDGGHEALLVAVVIGVVVFLKFLLACTKNSMFLCSILQIEVINFVYLQGSTERRSPSSVNFVTALAYHSCLALPAAFTQPGDLLLAEPCTLKLD